MTCVMQTFSCFVILDFSGNIWIKPRGRSNCKIGTELFW